MATFTPPSGWEKEATPSFDAYLRIKGNTLCQFSVYSDRPAGPGANESFAAEWTVIFAKTFLPGPVPRAVEKASPSGVRYAEGEGEVSDLNRNRFYTRLAMFLLGRRVQTVVGIATNKLALEGCGAEWAAFLDSVRFAGLPKAAAPAAAAAAPPAASAVARPGQFENFRYTLPPGWKADAGRGSVKLSPAGLQGMEDLAVVLLPSRPAGPLEGAFASTWNEIVQGYGGQQMRNVSGQVYDLEAARRTASGWEYLTGTGGFSLNYDVFTLKPYVFGVQGRIERLFVLAKDFRADLLPTNALSSPRLGPEVDQIIFGMRFTGMAEADRKPASVQGPGVTGVWAGLGMSFGKIKALCAILFSDGNAYFGSRFPVRGLIDIEPHIERERAVRDWGTWSMSGATGEIRMPYGSIPLRLNGNRLVVTISNTPHRFILLQVPTREQLAGRWCLDGDGGCLALTPEGRFQDGGVLRVVEHATYPYPTSLEQGAGQYELRDHTLIFRYDRGPEFRVAFPGLLEEQPEAKLARIWVSFNFDELTRR